MHVLMAIPPFVVCLFLVSSLLFICVCVCGQKKTGNFKFYYYVCFCYSVANALDWESVFLVNSDFSSGDKKIFHKGDQIVQVILKRKLNYYL